MYSIGALGLGGWELAIILLVVLIIFGPKQLPKLGKMLSKTVTEVRSGIDEAGETISDTGKPADAATSATPAPKFDPQTGEPLDAPVTPAPKFDPQTGEPLNQDDAKV